MSELSRLLRRGREGSVESGNYRFATRRPTDAEMSELVEKNVPDRDIARGYVIGWAHKDGSPMTRGDVVGDGSGDIAAFDVADWQEWIVDKSEHWTAIATAVCESYRQHLARKSEAVKKS